MLNEGYHFEVKVAEMAVLNSTGEKEERAEFVLTPTVEKNTLVHEGRSTVYSTPSKTLSSEAEGVTQKHHVKGLGSALGVIQNQILALQDEARRIASIMRLAAANNERETLGIEGTNLNEVLTTLWGYRKEQSDEWGMILTFLQFSLSESVYEKFSEEQCSSIAKVLQKHLRLLPDEEDVIAARKILEQSGLDTLKPLTGLLDSD